MIKRESIFKVTRIRCWETSAKVIEYIKAYDVNHAMRIANRLFDDVALVQKVEKV